MEMKLELVPMPVADVDRAKAFYVDQLGFVQDVDVRPTEGMRVVQLTRPGSACSILLGTGLQGISGETWAGGCGMPRSVTPTATPSCYRRCAGELVQTSELIRRVRPPDP